MKKANIHICLLSVSNVSYRHANMTNASAKESFITECTKVAVSTDGTWHKRGHISLNGILSIIGVQTVKWLNSYQREIFWIRVKIQIFATKQLHVPKLIMQKTRGVKSKIIFSGNITWFIISYKECLKLFPKYNFHYF
jgi:hypothetical protein